MVILLLSPTASKRNLDAVFGYTCLAVKLISPLATKPPSVAVLPVDLICVPLPVISWLAVILVLFTPATATMPSKYTCFALIDNWPSPANAVVSTAVFWLFKVTWLAANFTLPLSLTPIRLLSKVKLPANFKSTPFSS